MELSVSHEQGGVPLTVLHAKGNIDSTSYQEIQARAEQLLAEGTKNRLLTDLTHAFGVGTNSLVISALSRRVTFEIVTTTAKQKLLTEDTL